MKTKFLLYTGILIPIIFWLSTLICGFIHGNYNHLSGTISELGGIGTKSEALMTILTWLITLLSLFFIAGLFKACRQLGLNVIPVFTAFAFTFMFGWAATFHSGNPLHSASGPVFLLLYLGPLLVLLLWKGNDLKQIRLLSFISFAIMLLIFLRFIPSQTIENNYTGLIQRFAHLGWSVWFVSLSLGLTKLLNENAFQQSK